MTDWYSQLSFSKCPPSRKYMTDSILGRCEDSHSGRFPHRSDRDSGNMEDRAARAAPGWIEILRQRPGLAIQYRSHPLEMQWNPMSRWASRR